MKYSLFLVLSLLIILQVTAQRNKQPDQNLLTPIKPIDSNNTRIVYPSEDTNQNRRPTHVSSEGRRPIEDIRICYENELLYPGDNEGDWVCDCKPGYLHYPATGTCYEAYTQGPCQANQIIKLNSGSNIPVCVNNVCKVFGQVFFNSGCFPLNSDEGCTDFKNFIGRKVLLVPNPTTLELTCADEDFKYACVENCCKGSKREYRDICRKKRRSSTKKAIKAKNDNL